jgi:hypothetical protein
MAQVGEVLECQRRVMGGELVDQPTSQDVEARTDPIPLPPSLPTQQPASKATFVGLLLAEKPPPTHGRELEFADLRKGDPYQPRRVFTCLDTVQRRLVGIQGDERRGRVRFRDGLIEHEHDSAQADVDLGHPVVRVGQHLAMIVGDREGERSPLASAERQAQPTGSGSKWKELAGTRTNGVRTYGTLHTSPSRSRRRCPLAKERATSAAARPIVPVTRVSSARVRAEREIAPET